MRIAQLTYSYMPLTGGADTYAHQLRVACKEAGHEVVVYQRWAETNDPDVRLAPEWLNRFGAKAFWLVPYWMNRRRRDLGRFDVLVAHYPQYCTPARWHRHVVGLSHGVTWDDHPSARRSLIKKRQARWAFGACARYVANDTFFLREMGLEIAPGGEGFREVAPGKWYIPNCVDDRVFFPAPGDVRSPVYGHILVPRNIYHNRGVDLAVEAFARIASQIHDTNLVIVGEPSQPEAVAAVQEAIQRYHLQYRVLLAGSAPWEAMPELYRAALLTVIPSRCGEGTSLSALESMSCGTPVVSTDAGGLPDLPCVHARVDVDDLAEKMLGACERFEELGREQLAAVRQRHHRKSWVETWLRVIEGTAG
jgi:glycosyltransferase involved in cell wall biosynthesis